MSAHRRVPGDVLIHLRRARTTSTGEDLKAKGVEFLQEPDYRPYGVEALMRDNSGNWMVLVEKREYSPEDFEGVDLS